MVVALILTCWCGCGYDVGVLYAHVGVAWMLTWAYGFECRCVLLRMWFRCENAGVGVAWMQGRAAWVVFHSSNAGLIHCAQNVGMKRTTGIGGHCTFPTI